MCWAASRTGMEARLGATLFARKKNGYGMPLAVSAEEMARRVVARLERLSAMRVLEAALSEDGLDGDAMIASPLVARALDRSGKLVRAALLLDRPVIGLGAGAGAYYTAVGDLLGVDACVPGDADVANAIGAVVGRVRVSVTVEIITDEDGRFVLSGAARDLTHDGFAEEEAALAAARATCRTMAAEKARQAGAADIDVAVTEDIRAAMLDDQRQFISATLVATATGRPTMSDR